MPDKISELASLTFRNQSGQDLLDELKNCYVDRSNYVQGDTHETAYRLGMSHMVNMLINLSNSDEAKNG